MGIQRQHGLVAGAQRAKSEIPVAPAFPPDDDEYIMPDATLQNLIVSKSLLEDESAGKRRISFAGKYMNLDWPSTTEFIVLSDELNYIYQGFRTTLTEVEIGLFISPYGDAVDFRARPQPSVAFRSSILTNELEIYK